MNKDEIVKEIKKVLSQKPRMTHYGNYFFPVSEFLYCEIVANVNLADLFEEIPLLKSLELINVSHSSVFLKEGGEERIHYFFLVAADSDYIRELDKYTN